MEVELRRMALSPVVVCSLLTYICCTFIFYWELPNFANWEPKHSMAGCQLEAVISLSVLTQY